MSAPDADAKEPPADEEAEAPVEEAEGPAEPDDGGPLGKGLSWKAQRLEIARDTAAEPANHGRFAIGCSIVIAIVLVGFFVLRLYVMR